MTIKEVIDYLSGFPGDADVVFSEALAIDEANDIQGIIDCSTSGVSYDEETKELRFVLKIEEFKKCFPDIKIIDIPF